MKRPDWKQVPEWVQWVAQDADGCWHGYDHKPVDQIEEFSRPDLEPFNRGRFTFLERGRPDTAWRTSLEQRPEELPCSDKQSGTAVVSREGLSIIQRLLGIAEFEFDDDVASARKHADALRALLAATPDQSEQAPDTDEQKDEVVAHWSDWSMVGVRGDGVVRTYTECCAPVRHAKPRITVADTMRAYQSAARSPHLVGTSNWCAHMAEQLNTPQD